jgi:negative regulator of replication initiation
MQRLLPEKRLSATQYKDAWCTAKFNYYTTERGSVSHTNDLKESIQYLLEFLNQIQVGRDLLPSDNFLFSEEESKAVGRFLLVIKIFSVKTEIELEHLMKRIDKIKERIQYALDYNVIIPDLLEDARKFFREVWKRQIRGKIKK